MSELLALWPLIASITVVAAITIPTVIGLHKRARIDGLTTANTGTWLSEVLESAPASRSGSAGAVASLTGGVLLIGGLLTGVPVITITAGLITGVGVAMYLAGAVTGWKDTAGIRSGYNDLAWRVLTKGNPAMAKLPLEHRPTVIGLGPVRGDGVPTVMSVNYEHQITGDGGGLTADKRSELLKAFRTSDGDGYVWEVIDGGSKRNPVLQLRCSPIRTSAQLTPLVYVDGTVANDPMKFPIGFGTGDEVVCWNAESFPHCLLAGTTGSGKSTTQATILKHAFATGWIVWLADPKRVELGQFREFGARVETELEGICHLVEEMKDAMDARYKVMEEEGVNHFTLLHQAPPPVLLMVDEVFALLAPDKGSSDDVKARNELRERTGSTLGAIARLGRAAGMHLCLATQRPDAVVLPGEVKANLDCRIAQGRMDTIPSQMTLDSTAATQLPAIKGRCIVRQGNDFQETQAFFAPKGDGDEDLSGIMWRSIALLSERSPVDNIGPEHPLMRFLEQRHTDDESFIARERAAWNAALTGGEETVSVARGASGPARFAAIIAAGLGQVEDVMTRAYPTGDVPAHHDA